MLTQLKKLLFQNEKRRQNAHILIKELESLPGIKVCRQNPEADLDVYYVLCLRYDPKIWEKGVGIHAGESETSRQLYINSEHVKDERVDYVPDVGREFLDYIPIGSISEWGVWGYPSLGTREKGKQAVVRQVACVVEWARETFGRVEALRAGEG